LAAAVKAAPDGVSEHVGHIWHFFVSSTFRLFNLLAKSVARSLNLRRGDYRDSLKRKVPSLNALEWN
jgi:hypothetical protein